MSNFSSPSNPNQQDVLPNEEVVLNLNNLPPSPSTIQRHQSDGSSLKTQTSQDRSFLSEEQKAESYYSNSSVDFDSGYYKPKISDTLDTSVKRPAQVTSFMSFGGVGDNSISDVYLDDAEDDDDKIKPTPRERWHKAFLKVKIIRAFGGTIGNKEYELRVIAEDELLTSEREYYSRISVLVECFMKPLVFYVDNALAKAQVAQAGESRGSFSLSTTYESGGIVAAGGITESTVREVRKVFSNIAQIKEFTKTLLHELELAHAEPQGKIGEVFVKFADYLRLYSAYYQSFHDARMALDKLRSAVWCDAFISAIEAQPCCKGRGIKDFLIEPVQRVPRYEMLIKEVIRYTPPGHGNKPKLMGALEKVKIVADGMNMDMGSSDARLKVASLTAVWVGVDFTAPHRMFLKEGVLVKTDRHGSKRRIQFVLFNDLVCYGDRIDESIFFGKRRVQSGGAEDTDTSSSGDRYKLRFKAPLLECLVVDTSMVYSKHGEYRLWDESSYAEAMKYHMSNQSGQEEQNAIIDTVSQQSDNKDEASKAWSILQSCGVSLDRVLEAQLSEMSFFIHVEGKTLVITASTLQEKHEWVTAFADAIKNCLVEEKQHRNGQRRLSAIATRIEENHQKVVANPSRLARIGSFVSNALTRRPSSFANK